MYIYDGSALIHKGAKTGFSKSYSYKGFPTGAAFLFFRTLLSDLKRGEEVVLCFDAPSNTLHRTNYFTGYKINRRKQEGEVATIEQLNLIAQFNIIEFILKDIGIPILKLDGYESDDFIYSVVNAYPYTPITIRADDFDLIDTKLFNPSVNFISHASINSQETGEMKRKIISGCTSDKVPSLKYSNIHILDNIDLYKAKGITEPDVEYIKSVTNLTGEALEELARNIFLVVPHIIDLSYFSGFKPVTIKDIDIPKFELYLHALGLKSSLKMLGINELINNEETDRIINNFNHHREQVIMYEYGSLL